MMNMLKLRYVGCIILLTLIASCSDNDPAPLTTVDNNFVLSIVTDAQAGSGIFMVSDSLPGREVDPEEGGFLISGDNRVTGYAYKNAIYN
ncbi:MAG: hypothetical protein AAF843_12820, partial [Bacteroidota bacterium]